MKKVGYRRQTMENYMKKSLSTFFAMLLIAVSYTTVEAQQSDYEIQQEFRAEYSQLADWIDNAVSTDDLEEISDRIDELESDYSGYTDIINAAIYPDTYQSRIEDLRSRFGASQQNIATIEELNERVENLSTDLDDFRGQLAEMDERSESLQREIRDSQANERRLSNLVSQYRENVEERDRFVGEFLEDLLKRYESVDASTAAEIAQAAERLEENPVDLVRTILGEYVNYANQQTDLSAPEYLSMKAQHNYFTELWDNIGERLTQIFDAEEPVQAYQEVRDLLANWNSAIDNRLWGAISNAFSQNGIELDNFSNANAFNNALQSYVNDATQTSRDQNNEEDLERFRNFSNFWNNTVKANWGETLMASEVLSYSQLASIDAQLDDWNQAAIPTSNLMLILFLISVAVIIGLVVALVRKK
jgi:DNA repair exonuclease SbcCD ATPase subunit